jgi:hypothetical protein
MLLKIASDFSSTPGPRRRSEGNFSGEEFRQRILVPKLKSAMDAGRELVVDLDGTSGYGTSFLEEAFGGLIRNNGYSLTELQRAVKFVSNEEPDLLKEIDEYMCEAHERLSQ